MAVELRVLGQVELLVDGRPVEVGHARQRCVLAVLLVEANRVVTPEQLVERVWAGRLPHKARQVVTNYVSRLRRALPGEAVIARRGGGYSLEVDPASVDLHRFRLLVARARGQGDARALALLEEASRLWRGEAFEGLDAPWLAAVREGLARERFAADVDRVDLALARGRHAELCAELAERADAHPLDERVAGQLVLALHRSGRREEALARFEDIRARLADGLGADPGPDLRALHRQVLAAAPAPRQLPARPWWFTGRATELERLDESARVAVVAGSGGIGKTWLALDWAHRNADRFPDGQLFVDLRGFSPEGEPMDPAVAVRGFLDALGVAPGRVPVDPAGRTALFRDLVVDRRVLLVLDNAVDAAQVAPLLPGGGSCAVLVTSRNQLTGLAAEQVLHLPLDVLADDEARALLANRLGADRAAAEPAAVDELAGFCGGFPLALSIVAGHAHTHPDLPLALLAAELRDLGLGTLDDHDPTASLPAVLSWSLHDLTADQTTAFALLGIAPGPDIGLPAAASLTGLSPDRAEVVLHDLEQASLVARDASGRYRMHDLIRGYAAATAHRDLDADRRTAALRRVVDFCTRTAHAAERLLNPHLRPIDLDPPLTRPHPLPDVPAALAWLDTEHRVLLAAQQTAAAHRWHATTWQLAWSLTTFLYRRGHLHDALTAWRAALSSAEHLPDPAARTLAHRLLGSACAELGRHEEAAEHLRRALALAERQGDTDHLAHTHRECARAWALRGDHRRALDHARLALDLFRTLGQPVWQARALNAVGWYAVLLGDHDTAREHCRAALDLLRRHPNPVGEADTLDSLGLIDHRTGRHHESVEHYREALALFRAHGDTNAVADTLDALGRPHAALGQREQARAVWREARDLFRQQGREQQAERVREQLDALDRADDGSPG
ncbi:AfsR/SARP family transcriptional regulator [Saccharothrix xinjiangensis]|uniref:BTAD domain-containing putative transcriptional regulator n=1 Tax=Saccharothrix xinjiangensis TaxID=204798 RepID=A0ABV9XZX2_9PSEU